MESYLQLVFKYNKLIQTWFLLQTSQINFTAFCIIYSIILVFLIRKITEKKVWRPKNKQLKTFKEKIKQYVFSTIFGLPIIRYYIQKKLQKSMDEEEVKVIAQMQKQWDQKKSSSLPTQGMNEDNLRKKIFQWSEKQKKIWMTGKISGSFYIDQEQHMRKLNDFAATYLYHNPLHLDTYKQLLKMEKQILDMTNSLITSENKTYFGTVTSGGSQSLILALYAYKQFYSDRKKPNIVIPVTAHAAIDKGCFYLNIQARKARLNSNFQVDVNHMKSLIDKNTIMILGSAPNYPHGIIDPINQIAKLAKLKNVGCHIDACLGGFIGAFHKQLKGIYNLDRQGVTSMSLDHHKFGLAPKGVSSIFYKTRQLRKCQFYVNADWIGGLYATPTMPGSRSGFASAAAWYSLTQTTMEGFKQNAIQIVESTVVAAKRLSQVKGIQIFGNPKVCAFAFRTTDQQCSHLSLVDYLVYEKKWKISSIHKPDGIHVSVTLANCKNIRQNLWRDVEEGLKNLREKKQPKKSMSSTLYGTTTKIPTNGMQIQILKLLISTSTK